MKATIINTEINNSHTRPYTVLKYELLMDDGGVLKCEIQIREERITSREQIKERIKKYHAGTEINFGDE